MKQIGCRHVVKSVQIATARKTQDYVDLRDTSIPGHRREAAFPKTRGRTCPIQRFKEPRIVAAEDSVPIAAPKTAIASLLTESMENNVVDP